MMVPVGIDLDASCKSPDLFEPAMIPVAMTRMQATVKQWLNGVGQPDATTHICTRTHNMYMVHVLTCMTCCEHAPVQDGKKMARRMVKVVVMSATISPLLRSPGSSSPMRLPAAVYSLKMFSAQQMGEMEVKQTSAASH